MGQGEVGAEGGKKSVDWKHLMELPLGSWHEDAAKETSGIHTEALTVNSAVQYRFSRKAPQECEVG